MDRFGHHMRKGWGLRTPLVVSLLGALLIVGAAGRPAFAGAGESTDPAEGSSNLDIKRVYHSDGDGYVTYGLETYDGYDVGDDFYTVQWDFDFNNDGQPGDACIRVEQSTEETLRAVLYTDCGPESFGTAEVRKDGNTIEFRFPVKDLVDVGMVSGQTYGYRVTARDLQNHEDVTPDGRTLVTQSGVELNEDDVKEIDEQRRKEIVESQGGPEAAKKAAESDPAASGSQTGTQAGTAGEEGTGASQPTMSSGSGFPTGLLVALAIIAALLVAASLAVERRRRHRASIPDDPAHVTERL
jgi:hypothetical protein